jgi:hypothetical protein
VIAILIAIWWVSGSLSASQQSEQIKIAKEAIVRATVQCYALEGRYPQGLDYLVEHYGLTLDQDKYIYYYTSNGFSNMLPRIEIFPINGETGNGNG